MTGQKPDKAKKCAHRLNGKQSLHIQLNKEISCAEPGRTVTQSITSWPHVCRKGLPRTQRRRHLHNMHL